MMNNSNEKQIEINLYMTVSVSDELWDELFEEENDNALRKIANKYGCILMDDEEAETASEGTPIIYAIDSLDGEYSFYLA